MRHFAKELEKKNKGKDKNKSTHTGSLLKLLVLRNVTSSPSFNLSPWNNTDKFQILLILQQKKNSLLFVESVIVCFNAFLHDGVLSSELISISCFGGTVGGPFIGSASLMVTVTGCCSVTGIELTLFFFSVKAATK